MFAFDDSNEPLTPRTTSLAHRAPPKPGRAPAEKQTVVSRRCISIQAPRLPALDPVGSSSPAPPKPPLPARRGVTKPVEVRAAQPAPVQEAVLPEGAPPTDRIPHTQRSQLVQRTRQDASLSIRPTVPIRASAPAELSPYARNSTPSRKLSSIRPSVTVRPAIAVRFPTGESQQPPSSRTGS